jgi:DNA-binding NarL/FixJ family response regulator
VTAPSDRVSATRGAIRAVIVADTVEELGGLARAVDSVGAMCVVRRRGTRAHLDRVLADSNAELVVIAGLSDAVQALERLAEVRHACPTAGVVMLSAEPGAVWLADALRRHAAAVLPGRVQPRSLAIVLREVLAERRLDAPQAGESELPSTHTVGGGDGLLARVRVQLAQDVLDVRTDGIAREHESIGDLIGAAALRK